MFSKVRFSNNQIFWIVVYSFRFIRFHKVCFNDETGSSFQNEFIQSICNDLIAITGLGDDEVEHNDTSNDDNNDPQNPIK